MRLSIIFAGIIIAIAINNNILIFKFPPATSFFLIFCGTIAGISDLIDLFKLIKFFIKA